MVYSIVSSRSTGSKLWDIDGNEYIDLLNGFGPTMFGHSPAFVTEAVTEQMKEGFAIGPQTPLAGRAADLLAEMTGAERVTFCNTGSEAVMAAMRLARTVPEETGWCFLPGTITANSMKCWSSNCTARANLPCSRSRLEFPGQASPA